MKTNISIVIPCRNEETTLPTPIKSLTNALRDIDTTYDIVLVSDGCTDRTPEIAEHLASEHSQIESINHEKRLGKGKAFMVGLEHASSERIVLMDADIEIRTDTLESLLDGCKDHDIVVGSRLLPASNTERNAVRHLLSLSYNYSIRLMFDSDIHDHQCGCKVFKRNTIERLGSEIDSESWFWDTEILLEAQKRDIDVKEVPISWEENNETNVNLLRTTLHLGKKILQRKLT